MLMSYMSEEDIASLREFMDAGNGDAMYEYTVDNGAAFHTGDEYVALLKKSADAGCYLAAEELAYLFRDGEATEGEFKFQKDEEKSRKYEELAKTLEQRRRKSNESRILSYDFYGWVDIRWGENTFSASYVFPSFPLYILQMCIDKLAKGGLMSEWFSDEEHRYDISEELVDGIPRLFIRWEDDERRKRVAEFPGYEFRSFATRLVDDIEADYFGFAYFMTTEGIGFADAINDLKQTVVELRAVLKRKGLELTDGAELTK